MFGRTCEQNVHRDGDRGMAEPFLDEAEAERRTCTALALDAMAGHDDGRCLGQRQRNRAATAFNIRFGD